MADVKGDISGISQAGTPHPKVDERLQFIGMEDYRQRGFPVAFWDLFGKLGTPIRTTVTEMGPQLLSRLLDLNDTQEGVMTVVFEFADSEGLLLVDLADLRTTLEYLGEHSAELGPGFGVARASVNAILRRLLMLEREGGRVFFGEPSLELKDFMQTTRDGRGVINLLAADTLIQNPRVYSTFLLWLLSELFEELPEVGNPDRPKLVFFFDEAHLLFDGAPKALVDKVEQVVRLIRSKGVGIYFVTQKPVDVPDDVLAQLGNRVQHALRAFTARDRRDLKLAAQTYRDNPRFSTEEAIREVGTGEAVTSFLERKGIPGMVERTLVRPPSSQLGPIDPGQRAVVMAQSPVVGKYEAEVDRDSAYERLRARAEAAAHAAATAEAQQAQDAREEIDSRETDREFNSARRYSGNTPARKTATRTRRSSRSDSIADAFAKSFARQLGTRGGQALVRGILGSLFKSR